ncbi:MAG: CCA tRNA nucleotidyltransferase [Chloroflexi bacterium]|nr:CCA tRNA nucleotidyltransferase [Chloroflexota bacterium]
MSLAETGPQGPSGSLFESKLPSLLTRVSHFLVEQGIQSYIVGGWVRDVLLGRETADIDLAIGRDALEVAPKVAAILGGKYVLLDEVNRISRVVIIEREATTRVQWYLDFSTFDGTIEQDLARRDFTVDAMAIDLNELVSDAAKSALIDPFNGWEDLRQRLIRAVTDTVFAADPVRLLRAVRLAAELGFTIEKKTEALIKRDSRLLSSVPGERVREELVGLLDVPGAGQFLSYLDELGLLTTLIPELAQTKGVEQPKEHHWDVFQHMIRTVTAAEFLLRQGTWEYDDGRVLEAVPWSDKLAEHFDNEVSSGSTRRAVLKLAALLHDIAKPQTKALIDGRTRFLGHGKEGATVVVNILERLRFSNKEIKLVETEVEHHLRPGQMSQEGLPTQRAVYRYFRDTGDAGIDILFLSLADHLATRGPDLDLSHWQQHTSIVEYVLAQQSQEQSIVRLPKLIDGHDIINIFRIDPGPRVGEVLEAVREAQASGELKTRGQALDFARRMLTSSHSLDKDKYEEKG